MCVPFNELTLDPEGLLGLRSTWALTLAQRFHRRKREAVDGMPRWPTRTMLSLLCAVVCHGGRKVRAAELPEDWVRTCVGSMRSPHADRLSHS